MAFARFLAFFILFGIFGLPEAKCQIYKISGRIVDSETLEPLPYAHVFIDQTTIGAVSDFNGEFVIDNLANGEYKLVYSFVGYELFYKLVTINDKDARASVRLIPQKGELQNVEVKGTRDKEWESQLKQFKQVFFGNNEYAKECKLLNPWVLDFDYDKKEKKFRATAGSPIEIENRALGYSIVCNLLGFTFDKNSYRIRGFYKFEEINTLDNKEAIRWTRNRKLAYQNSLRFLMKSIIDNHTRENGFTLYMDNRPANYTLNTGFFSDEILKKNVEEFKLADRLKPIGRPGYYSLQVDKRLEIHHTTQFARVKTYKDVPYSVSWIEVEKDILTVMENGAVVNNDNIVTSGELSNYRIASMLPLNYSPGSFVVLNYLTKRNSAKRLQEKVYLQTDKNVYYPGERLYYKAHMNYANQSIRDSLSRILYVELLDSKAKVVQLKMISLDSLGGRGDFDIPGYFRSGAYYLRAYTKWMLNYGLKTIECQPILISDPLIKLVPKVNNTVLPISDFVWDFRLSIDSSLLSVGLDSMLNQGVSNCSISIVPVESVLHGPPFIKSTLTFEEDLPEGTLPEFPYPIEYGFSIEGKIEHPKKSHIQAQVTAIQGKMDSIYSFKTDRKGNFSINELNFEDSTTISIQAKDRKGRILKSKLIPRFVPNFSKLGWRRDLQFDTIQINYPIRFTKTPISLNETVTLKSEEVNQSIGRFVDYILTNDDLERLPQDQTLIMVLQNKVPGLRYDFSTRSFILGSKLGNSEVNEPLFILDGMPIFTQRTSKVSATNLNANFTIPKEQSSSPETHQSTPDNPSLHRDPIQVNMDNQAVQEQVGFSSTDMVSHLTVSALSRIEVTTRMDPRYGTLGANGVIAIYTKKVQGKSDQTAPINLFQINGLSRPRSFERIINYSGHPPAEYTPTWYWNPDVQISSTQFTQIKFPTLPKGVVFRVSINGVTKAGTPVSGSFLLNGGNTKPVSASLDQRQK